MVKKNNLHVDLTPELIERAQKKFDLISGNGCAEVGVLDIDTTIKPDWYDEERLKRAQALILEHYAAYLNSSIFGLLMFFQLPICLVVLLATGKSKDSVSLFNRALNTFLFLDEWYQSDPFDPKSKAFKSLSMVKTMHANASKLMNKKVKVFDFAKKVLKQSNPEIKDEEVELYIRHKDRVWISQFDNAITEWAILGCMILEPEVCGFHNATKEDIEDFMYAWKVFGYRLGVDLKYSIFEEIDYDLNYALCKIILEQEYIPHMENNCAPSGIRMMDGILKLMKDILGNKSNFENFNFYFRFLDVYLRYWYKVFNVNCNKLNRSLFEHNEIKLIKSPIKNQLTEEDKKIMLKNGYNDKYIVSDYNQPFELFKLNGFRDKMMYQCVLLYYKYALKYQFVRNISKNTIRNSLINTVLDRQNAINKASELSSDPRLKFSECPFAGSIRTEQYPDVYQEKLDSSAA